MLELLFLTEYYKYSMGFWTILLSLNLNKNIFFPNNNISIISLSHLHVSLNNAEKSGYLFYHYW